MKFIEKTQENQSFTDWKIHNPDAIYALLKGLAKADLKQSLIDEQKGICCYCERHIMPNDSHIEHFKPKGEYPVLQLDYSNLHASCRIFNNSNTPDICGHRKNEYYTTDLISPLESDCARNFTYTLTGKINPELPNNNRAIVSINTLGLDQPFLNEARESLIKYFEEIDDDEQREAEIINHLDKNKPQHEEFFTMIEYLHGKGWM